MIIALAITTGIMLLPLVLAAESNPAAKESQSAEPATAVTPPVIRHPYIPRGAYTGVAHYGYGLEGQFDPKVGPAEAVKRLAQRWDEISVAKHALQQTYHKFPRADGVFPSFDFGYESGPNKWSLPLSAFCEGARAAQATPYISLHPMARFELFYTDWRPGNDAFEATVGIAKAVGRIQGPVFVDFAREANGWWDVYSVLKRQPDGTEVFLPEAAQNFKTAWNNFAAIMRQYAPNAALVFNVNQGYLSLPGHDHFRPLTPDPKSFDWVSLSLYDAEFAFNEQGGHKLWGGLLGHKITHDDLDDPATEANESVNWYHYYGVELGKPLMLETAASTTHRIDLYPDAKLRAEKSHQLKAGYWNSHEYGWIAQLFATSASPGAGRYHYLIDQQFPQIKAIVTFQVAAWELMDGPMPWVDNRIGWNQPLPPVWAQQPGSTVYDQLHPVTYDLSSQWYYPDEIELYRGLVVGNPYFETKVR